MKCPYSIDDCDFDSYTKVDGKMWLKRNQQYYYQVQQQLHITGRQFCDFVVCAFSNGTPMFFMERIFPDINNWEITVLKITKVWRTCILPELLTRWYTRKQHV